MATAGEESPITVVNKGTFSSINIDCPVLPIICRRELIS
jgi:hypothetical protein